MFSIVVTQWHSSGPRSRRVIEAAKSSLELLNYIILACQYKEQCRVLSRVSACLSFSDVCQHFIYILSKFYSQSGSRRRYGALQTAV